MTPYVDFNYYKNSYFGTVFNEDNNNFKKYVQKASQQIDTLTFNRIVARGFENLTDFQKEKIMQVVCEMADFICENEDVLESAFSSYSINGVSMGLKDGLNLLKINGIYIQESSYNLLSQTGLTCRNARC
jgi:hypothetical protein